MFKKENYWISALVIGLFIFLAYCSNSDGESSTVDLNASVSFTDNQFVITNNDNFDYNNAKLEVNGEYVLKENNLEAGETYTVGMMQFADKKGNRFTALQKPQDFTISCDLNSGKKGWYYAEWN